MGILPWRFDCSLEIIREVPGLTCNITNPLKVYLSGMIRQLKGRRGGRGLLFIGLLLVSGYAFSQTEAEYIAEYNKRITMEMINGVYIPADLDDAFSELNRLSDPKGIAEFKNTPEDSIRRKLHFGLGKWMLVNWGMEDGSRISHYLKQKGITLPDDMVEYLIIMWHRNLNGKPLRSEEEIARIQKRMAEDQKKRDEDKKVISVEKKPHKD